MKLEDALFHWLQMKLVCDARPEDQAAKETLAFFAQILEEDHQLLRFALSAADDREYTVSYENVTGSQCLRFDRDLAEQLLRDIESNPKFNQ